MRWARAALLFGAVNALVYPRHPSKIPTTTGVAIEGNSTDSDEIVVVGTTKTVTVCPTATSSEYQFPYDRIGPMATLTPALPHDHDFDEIKHLTPHEPGAGAPMHYASSQSYNSGGIYAVAVPRWSYPSVVLDHSGFIISVQIDGSGNLVISFSDEEAFSHCANTWTADEHIFITYTESCGDYDKGQRCYFHAKIVTFHSDSLSIHCEGQAMPMEEVVIDLNVAWGNYAPQPIEYGAPSVATSTLLSSATGSGSLMTPSSSSSATYTAYTNPTSECVAPVDTKYDLPTACWGPDFDEDLDNGLGHFDASGSAYNFTLEGIGLDPAAIAARAFTLDSLNPVPIFKKAVGKVDDTRKQLVQQVETKVVATVKEVKEKVVQTVTDGVQKVVQVKDRVIQTVKDAKDLATSVIEGRPIVREADFDKLLLPRPAKECKDAKKDAKKSKDMSNACKPKKESGAKTVASPWGEQAVLLKSFGDTADPKNMLPKGGKKQTKVGKGQFINFYCVGCGLTGSLKAKGNVTIDLKHGITDGKIDGSLDLKTSINLGIYASFERSTEFIQNLYDIPLSPFTLGFISVGPLLSIGTSLKFSVNMTGAILAGVDASIMRANFTYDFKKGGNIDANGFQPQWTPKFNATGQVKAAAQFGLPIGLEFGVTVGNGCEYCKGTITIETVPSIKAEAAIAFELDYDGKTKNVTKGITALNNCSGISTTLTVRNDVNGVIKGFGLLKRKGNIHETKDYIIASYCIGNKTDNTTSGRIGWLGAAEEKRSLALPEGPVHNHLTYDFTRRGLDNSTAPSNHTTTVNTSLGAASSTIPEIYDLTQYVVEDDIDIGYQGFTRTVTPWNEEDFDGYWFSTVEVDTGVGNGGTYVLASCSDGNIYVQRNTTTNNLPWYITCTTLWAGYKDTVLSPPNGGILHYYSNTMSKLNVSRLRVSDEEDMPASSVWVALSPFYYEGDDSGASLLAAADIAGNVFFPAICTYKKNQTAKVYLVTEDIDAGIAMLKSPDVAYSITNGEVDDCFLLSLSVTDPEDGAWAELDDTFYDDYESDPIELEFDGTMFDTDGNLLLPKTLLVANKAELEDYDAVFDDPAFNAFTIGQSSGDWDDE